MDCIAYNTLYSETVVECGPCTSHTFPLRLIYYLRVNIVKKQCENGDTYAAACTNFIMLLLYICGGITIKTSWRREPSSKKLAVCPHKEDAASFVKFIKIWSHKIVCTIVTWYGNSRRVAISEIDTNYIDMVSIIHTQTIMGKSWHADDGTNLYESVTRANQITTLHKVVTNLNTAHSGVSQNS